MKIPSRNREKNNIDTIECPYCGFKMSIFEEKETDYYMFSENTKVNICRMCGFDFINGVTKDIEYKYSGKCKLHKKLDNIK